MKEVIKSRSNARVKEWLKLRNGKDPALYLIEGEIMVNYALELGVVETLITTNLDTPSNLANEVIYISKEVASKLSSYVTSQNVFATIKKDSKPLDTTKPLIYLDDIKDPSNLGAIMRSALAFDFGGVIASRRSVNFYNDKVISTAKGAHFILPIANMNEDELIEFCKKNTYKLTTTRLEKAQKSTNFTFLRKTMLVVGNEARGVSPSLHKHAYATIHIPIKHIDSLNVAIAASILMEKIANQ